MHGVAACVLRDKGRRRWRVFKAKAEIGVDEEGDACLVMQKEDGLLTNNE